MPCHKSFLFLGSLLVGVVAMNEARAELQVGDEAPAFELKASDGKTYKLSDFKGKSAVVLAWYPKAKTGGCTKECKSLRDSSAELKRFEVAYFGASCDEVQLNKEFAEELKLDFPLLCDPERKVAEAYGVVDATQKNPRRWTAYVGKDGKILHIDKGVKTESHGADVAGKLKELGIPERK